MWSFSEIDFEHQRCRALTQDHAQSWTLLLALQIEVFGRE
jgi:hypothetical protein